MSSHRRTRREWDSFGEWFAVFLFLFWPLAVSDQLWFVWLVFALTAVTAAIVRRGIRRGKE